MSTCTASRASLPQALSAVFVRRCPDAPAAGNGAMGGARVLAATPNGHVHAAQGPAS